MSPTNIEWTDETWNPVTGCTKVSEGCRNCYAERMSKRLAGRCGYPADEPFRVTLHPDRLEAPLRWRKPRRVFVCSMSDLFHLHVPFDFIAAIFHIMAACPQHTFQVLTKRPAAMQRWFRWAQTDHALVGGNQVQSANWNTVGAAAAYGAKVHSDCLSEGWDDRWPLPNVWLGTSAEDQKAFDQRWPHVAATPAAIRFVSLEPLLGGIDLDCTRLFSPAECFQRPPRPDWVICGGESGPGARPMHPDWVRSIRDQCVAAGVPFLFKQFGEWANETVQGTSCDLEQLAPNQCVAWGDGKTNHIRFTRVGKEAAGRELDGQLWNEFPKVTP